MNILVTNVRLVSPSGTELFTRDIAAALQARGHRVAVYTASAGRIASGMAQAGLTICRDLEDLSFRPDIIHGQHLPVLVQALIHFPRCAAIQVVHDATSPLDAPLPFHRIRRYVAVDDRCRARLDAIADGRKSVILNFVDLARFPARAALPPAPRRALVFSNYASGATHLPALRDACARIGLPLDVMGEGAGTVSHDPGLALGRYDLVFAKARCALEAMAVGAAVIACDFSGLGEMVTPDNFDALRRMNFGAGIMTRPLSPDAIIGEIRRYAAADAATVSARVRREAGLDTVIDEWLSLYDAVLAEGASRPDTPQEAKYLAQAAAHWSPALRIEKIKRAARMMGALPGVGAWSIAAMRRVWRSALFARLRG